MAIIKEAGRIFRDPFPLKHDFLQEILDLLIFPWSINPPFLKAHIQRWQIIHLSIPSIIPCWGVAFMDKMYHHFCFEWTIAAAFKRAETKWLKHFACFFPNLHLTSLGISAPNGFVLTAKAVTADARMHPSSPSRTARISLQELSLSLQDFLARHGPIQLSRVDGDWCGLTLKRLYLENPEISKAICKKKWSLMGGVHVMTACWGKGNSMLGYIYT